MGVYTLTYRPIVESAMRAGAVDPLTAVRTADPATEETSANFLASSGVIFPSGIGRFFVRFINASLWLSLAWFSAWLADEAKAVPPKTQATDIGSQGAATK